MLQVFKHHEIIGISNADGKLESLPKIFFAIFKKLLVQFTKIFAEYIEIVWLRSSNWITSVTINLSSQKNPTWRPNWVVDAIENVHSSGECERGSKHSAIKNHTLTFSRRGIAPLDSAYSVMMVIIQHLIEVVTRAN